MSGDGVEKPYLLTDLLRESARVRDGYASLERTNELAKSAFSLCQHERDDELSLDLLLILLQSRRALSLLRDVGPVQREGVPDWLQHHVSEIEQSMEAVLESLDHAINVRHPDCADKLVLQCQWLLAGAESLASYLKVAAKAQCLVPNSGSADNNIDKNNKNSEQSND